MVSLMDRVERATGTQAPYGRGTEGRAAWMESVGKRAAAQEYRYLAARRAGLKAAVEADVDE